ncbi:hypothetical protein BN381_80331 [Candidatus Microthrix parvicella RN1]|uniref:Uncharacterized protein n=1 Tax=Candidatus Neomicrothrix parvicella RN1 TaxID=1229780 RepID=R4Z715_9ACTN|nr:hypothetical protein BN381_80331 [Candidatus Microthrix parvicella RN1]
MTVDVQEHSFDEHLLDWPLTVERAFLMLFERSFVRGFVRSHPSVHTTTTARCHTP